MDDGEELLDDRVRSQRIYCRATAADGRVCVLYRDHIAEEHQENHGRSRWKGDARVQAV